MRPILLALALCLTACGGGDPAAQTADIDESERQLGAEQHPQLLAEFGGAYPGPEATYLERLGRKIAGAADLEGQCTFTLVNSDVVNAFAVPGCYIYVTRGLMGIVNSEAELASVLAHEVGHIVGDHGERQQKRSFWRGLGVIAVGFFTGSETLTRIAGQAAQYFTLRYSRNQEYESDDLGIRYLRAAGYDPHAAAD
ncbi:MAG: M48 family metalloprotease, partial [Pseudomonadota bacterium]|nr:M48 family metalloprotease [Pseudomonadota bacterium]